MSVQDQSPQSYIDTQSPTGYYSAFDPYESHYQSGYMMWLETADT
uniref:Uncharacterized protein n=1 Tax=Lepeophtheirus salmonis TaxID=72036 RepID=A0A0K2UQD7_LEPSM